MYTNLPNMSTILRGTIHSRDVGSGKTTLLTYCSSKSGVETHPELIEKYTNVGGENLLVSSFHIREARNDLTQHNNR